MALPEDNIQEDDNDFFDYATDILAAPFRGIEGAVQGAYNLADYLSFDILPDYDTRFLGTSKTMAGGAVEGISQFATGFIPLFGLAGRAGALAKAGTVTKGVVAGAATDFTFFNGQEARLSNLIQQVPELQNPVTEYLAYDGDESELEGRMKNVLEGLGLEAVAGVFIKSLKAMKDMRKGKGEGKTADEINNIGVESLNKGIPFSEEFKISQVTEDDSFLARQQGQKEFEKDFREVGGDPEESFEIDLTQDYSGIDLDEPSPSAITLTKEESETIQAGGQLISETNVGGKIIKKYQLPSGSTRTLISDPQNPDLLIDAASIIPKERTALNFAPGGDKPFYVYSDGKQFGPFNREQVQERLSANVFKPTDKIAQAGDQDWVDASKLIKGTEESTVAVVGEDIPLGLKRSPFIDANLTKIDDDAFDAVEIKTTKELDKLEAEMDSFPMRGTELDAPIEFKRKLAAAQDAYSAVELEKFRRQINGEEAWFIASEFRTLAGGTQNAETVFKLALLGETVKKRGIQDEVLTELKGKIGKDENAKEVFEGQLKNAQEAMDAFKKPSPKPAIEAFKETGFDSLEEVFPAPGVRTADYDAELGRIGPELKKDFYNKTLVEGVSSRMQTGKPMTAREAIQDLSDRTNGNLGEYSPVVKKLLALGKNTGIDAKLEERSFASDLPTSSKQGSFYEGGKRRIVLDGQSSLVKENPVYVLLHEATHAVTVDNVDKYYNSTTFKNIDVSDIAARAKAIDTVLKTKGLPKPVAEMFRMFKKADAMRDEIAAKGELMTLKGKPDLYWIENPSEFMSMAFSDPKLQQALKGIQYTPKMTMWEKVVNTIKSFFGRGVSTDLADNIVSRVGEIAEMKLPSQRGRGVDMMPGGEVSDLDKFYYGERNKYSNVLGLDQERRVFKHDYLVNVQGKTMPLNELERRYKNAIAEEAYEEANNLKFYLNRVNKKIDKHLKKYAKEEGYDLEAIGLKDADLSTVDLKPKLQEFDFAPEGRGVDYAPEGRGIPDFKKGKEDEFLSAIPDKFRGYAEALMVGGVRPRLPQFALETDGDVVVLKDILEKYYKENPDEVTVEGAITEIDTEIEQRLMLQEGKDAATKVAEARIVQQSLRVQANGVIDNLTDAVDEYERAGGGTAAIAKLKNNFQQLLSVADVYRKLGREGSLLLGSRRENYGKRKIGLSESDLQIEGIRNAFINASGGMHPDKLVKLIQETIDKENSDSMLASMFKIAKKAQGKNFLDMPTEYWMNAILSGPRTQMVNIIGNGLTQVMSTLEAVVGGVASGNLSVVKAVLASWSNGQMWGEAAKFAKKAFKQNDNLLDPQNRAFSDRKQGAITGERIAESKLGGMVTEKGLTSKKSLDAFGNFIRIPSRLLLTTDEFFKQLSYRRAARLKAAMSGIQQGIKDPKKLAEHIHNTLEGIVTEGGRISSEEGLYREGLEAANNKGLKGSERDEFAIKYSKDNFDKTNSALMQYALDEAQYLTFTRDLQEGTLGKVLQDATSKLPMLRLVLPFVRTPTNILKYAFERTPGVFVLKEERGRLISDLKSGDPVRRSQALGKMMTSVTVAGVFLDTAYNNREYITGGGPRDPKEKKALEATGWRPYSLKIGDTYYSYQRLDPLATLLGVGADLVEAGVRDKEGFDQSGLERVFLALTLSFTRNATNKSYLAGIQSATDALSDPDRYMARFGRNFASSFVPNIISQMADYDTQSLKEVRSMGDAFARKLGARGSLDKKRNLLGEEYMAEQWMGTGFINPIAMSPVKDDPVLTEMASLNHAFRPSSPNLGGQINLIDHENEQGQTAYDRQTELLKDVKIGGRTLRTSLQRLIKSRPYQRLEQTSEPGFPSPRIEEINKVLRRYRKEAKKQMLTEFPELAAQYNKALKAKAGLRGGMQREDVLELLQQTN